MSEKSNKITGGEAVVKILQGHGVKYIFGVCGDTSLPFYDALRNLNHGMTHVLARDEPCAGYMADVYARLTSKVGVVEGPSGAGATYMVPGIAEAQGTTYELFRLAYCLGVSQILVNQKLKKPRSIVMKCCYEAFRHGANSGNSLASTNYPRSSLDKSFRHMITSSCSGCDSSRQRPPGRLVTIRFSRQCAL